MVVDRQKDRQTERQTDRVFYRNYLTKIKENRRAKIFYKKKITFLYDS